ncbi:hypothetical protein T484DRAFT_1808881, partial [Baffinella frigidus]
NVLGAAHALLTLLPPPLAPAEAVGKKGKKDPPQKPPPGRELPAGIDVQKPPPGRELPAGIDVQALVHGLAGASSPQTRQEALRYLALVHGLAGASSPQTRQEALRCLVAVSAAAPEAMLKHVVPVLALLGRRVALSEDHYSMHVLEGALKAIVPPLLSYGMRPLTVLRVMVPAFDAISPHRRLRLHAWLAALLSSSGTSSGTPSGTPSGSGGSGEDGPAAGLGSLPRTLADLLLLLLARPEAGPSSGKKSGKKNGSTRAPDEPGSGGDKPASEPAAADTSSAAGALLSQFPAAVQLHAASLLVDDSGRMAVSSAPAPAGGPAADARPAWADAVASEGAVRALRVKVGALLAACLRSRALSAQLQALPPAEEEKVQKQLLALLEKMLHTSGQQMETDSDGEEEEGKGIRNSPMEEALQLVAGLLLRQRAVSYLSDKLQLLDASLPPDHQELLLSLLQPLSHLLRQGVRASKLVRQLSLGGIQTLARLFAPLPANKPLLMAAAPTVVGCLEREGGVVGAAAATCVATLVVHLGVAMLPHVNKALPRILALLPPALDALAPSAPPLEDAARDDALVLASSLVSAASRITAALPSLVSPYIPALAAALTHPALTSLAPPARDTAPGEEALLAAGAAARAGIAESVAPRILVPVLQQALASAVATSPSSTVDQP